VKKNKLNRTTGLLHGAKVDSIHPLVGAWKQEPNPVGTTTVIYTVFVKNGKFGVVGSDGEEGTALKISRTRWDGESLQFTSVYPPSKHKSEHVLRLASKGKINHDVSCTYADGSSFSGREVWTKKRSKKKPS
jgi:hypothetical protein